MAQNILKKSTFIALGSNLRGNGLDSEQTLVAAIAKIDAVLGPLTHISALYATPCFPVGAGPDFCNAVVACQSDLSAQSILEKLHQIEADFGRTRAARWDARSLDLDLLACGDDVLPDQSQFQHWFSLPLDAQKRETPDQLILPHPRLQDRGFVLVPLAEILPQWRHPVLGKTALELRDALPKSELDQITVISGVNSTIS